MKRFLAAALVLVAASPASAGWKVDSFKDRMTDRPSRYAISPAKEPDRGIPAQMRVGCMNGAPMISLDMGAELTRGQIGVVWRFDEEPQRPVFLRVFSDPRSVPFVGVDPAQFVGKKRFRLQIQPTGAQPLFWEFDVSGLGKVLPDIQCKN